MGTLTLGEERDFSGEWAIPPASLYNNLSYWWLILAVVDSNKNREFYEYSWDADYGDVIKEYWVSYCLHRWVDDRELQQILACKINNKRLIIEPVGENKFDVYQLKWNTDLGDIIGRVPTRVMSALSSNIDEK